ncbi:NAD(P)H-hydrate dehydratase [Candidatus Poribacteria bacterium]|nr:NAD(P)H-hydrate dehydratase [Candidatus Poribacteria bacterium]
MKVVTANEMRRIDQQTIERIGIPGVVLMENAGSAVVRAIQRHFPECKRIAVMVGKGNNGGDGLVVARQLALAGRAVQIFLVSPPERFTGDALTNLHIAQNLHLPIVQILSENELDGLKSQIVSFDLMIDAIFGTGLRGAVRGYIADVIECINAADCLVLAVDLPSGLEADTGMAEGACIRADYTVTIGLPKRGLLLYPGADMTGELEVADIGFPPSVIAAQKIQVNWTQPADAARLILPRPRHSHKGTYGRVFVVAGSTGMTGAAALSSEAALRVGAGLVTLGMPKSLNPILEVKLTEVMTLPLPETAEGSLASEAKSQILEFAERTNSVFAIGPGLSQHPETVALIHSLLRESRSPTVIDADGLNALAKSKGLLSSLPPQTVLTPHPGEMTRLVGGTVAELERDRIGIAQRFAQEHGVTLVLKGVPTVIANGNGEIWMNSTGNPGMATAGMGDVLTGIIVGLMAQGVPSDDAAVLGVYLHGLAGDIAAQLTGMHGLMAGDVLKAVPEAIEACLKHATR